MKKTKPRTGDRASCEGKKRYTSYSQAERSSKGLLRRRHNSKINIYRCDNCSFYHIGNTMGKFKHKQVGRNVEKREYRGGIQISE